MPLTSAKLRTNTGKTIGAAPATGDYDYLLSAAAVYADGGGGDVCVSVASVGNTAQSIIGDNLAGDSRYGQFSIDVRFSAATSSATQLAEIRNDTSKVTNIFSGFSGANPTVLVRGGGDALLTGADSTGAITLPVWSTATVLALNTWYRIQIAVDAGTTTSNGKTKATLTRLSDNTVLATGARENLNNLTASIAKTQFGKLNTTNTIGVEFDNASSWDNAYEYPPVAVDPPVVSYTRERRQVMDFTGSSGATSLSVTQLSGPTVTLVTNGLVASFLDEAVRTQDIVIRATVTGPGGSVAQDVTIPVGTGSGASRIGPLIMLGGVLV